MPPRPNMVQTCERREYMDRRAVRSVNGDDEKLKSGETVVATPNMERHLFKNHAPRGSRPSALCKRRR